MLLTIVPSGHERTISADPCRFCQRVDDLVTASLDLLGCLLHARADKNRVGAKPRVRGMTSDRFKCEASVGSGGRTVKTATRTSYLIPRGIYNLSAHPLHRSTLSVIVGGVGGSSVEILGTSRLAEDQCCSRSLTFCNFPLAVRGSASTNVALAGHLKWAN